MLVDKVDIHVKAGKGGNGSVSFRREKYVSHGGPDGGDGGNGGSVILVPDQGESTLLAYKYNRKFIAEDGENGSNKKFHGRNGEDVLLRVPLGTVVRDRDTGKVIHDMSDGEQFIIAHGGRGGWGNVHFATSTRQAPHFARAGMQGEELFITLELKMLADVGIIGYPNVGKSTLLSMVSSAHPRIASYQFTTLSPNLGVISAYGRTFVMADIPGLVDGASEGKGLGHEFLRHIERCRLLVHVFDISASERPDPLEDIKNINKELKSYASELASRPQILVGNKIDQGYGKEVFKKIKAYAARKKQPLFLIAADLDEGLSPLMEEIARQVALLPAPVICEREYFAPDTRSEAITVKNVNGVYFVTGGKLRRLCENVNFDDRESLAYFQRMLREYGVIEMLENKGIQECDTVDIYGIQFDFVY
ncbi:MAG: GTPase ObgE [Clostridia bacterium]|nr:GTPase ObgE [Clostridia bacterium]MBR5031849.1 GTPase ObgE [Clostridia bacterium]